MVKKPMNLEAIGKEIVDAAVKVHRVLGPGLLESAYQQCLVHELRQRGLNVKTEIVMPIVYEGYQIDAGYRLDVLVEDAVVVENKAVSEILPIHQAQLLTYLKLTNCQLGYLRHGSGQLYKFVGRFGKSSRGRFTKSPYKLLSTVCRLLNHALFTQLECETHEEWDQAHG
ncbi:MAG: GxxExxY protein [Candidatus Promineifilaceae bacterium]